MIDEVVGAGEGRTGTGEDAAGDEQFEKIALPVLSPDGEFVVRHLSPPSPSVIWLLLSVQPEPETSPLRHLRRYLLASRRQVLVVSFIDVHSREEAPAILLARL